MKQFRLFFAVLLATAFAALAVGCASLGVPTPETFKEKLAVSVAINQSVRETALTLLATKKITADDAQNVQDQANVAREGLNVARTLSGTDLASASGRLEATTAALKALQQYLITKQGASK